MDFGFRGRFLNLFQHFEGHSGVICLNFDMILKNNLKCSRHHFIDFDDFRDRFPAFFQYFGGHSGVIF